MEDSSVHGFQDSAYSILGQNSDDDGNYASLALWAVKNIPYLRLASPVHHRHRPALRSCRTDAEEVVEGPGEPAAAVVGGRRRWRAGEGTQNTERAPGASAAARGRTS